MSGFDSQIEYKPIVEPLKKKGDVINSDRITVGAGSGRFEVNVKEGLWLGADTFDDAPASIDFDGNSLFSSVTIKNDNDDILIDSNSTTKDYIQIINSSLNTNTKQILSDFTFLDTDYAGAFKTGDIAWNSSGTITGGTGGVFNAKGLIFAKSGTPTITLNGLTGDATFAGEVSGIDGTFGTITSGTIRGCDIYSSSSSNRVALRSGNYFQVVVSGSESGRIYGDSSGDIYIQGEDDVIFRAGGSTRCQVTTASLKPTHGSGTGNQVYDLGTDPSASGYGFRRIYGEVFYGGSSGTAGDTQSGYGFVNGIRWNGGTLQYRFSEITVNGGIVTGFDEKSWGNV